MRLTAIVALSLAVISASALPVPNPDLTGGAANVVGGLTNGQTSPLNDVKVSHKVNGRSTPSVDPSQLGQTLGQAGKAVTGKARRSTPNLSQGENALKQVEGETTTATGAAKGETAKGVAGARRTTPNASQAENAVKQVEGEVGTAAGAVGQTKGVRRATPDVTKGEDAVKQVEGDASKAAGAVGQTKGVAGARRTTPNLNQEEAAVKQAEAEAAKAAKTSEQTPKGVPGARRTTPNLSQEEAAAKQVEADLTKGTSVQTAKGVSARANGDVNNGSAGQLTGTLENAKGTANGENTLAGGAVSDA